MSSNPHSACVWYIVFNHTHANVNTHSLRSDSITAVFPVCFLFSRQEEKSAAFYSLFVPFFTSHHTLISTSIIFLTEQWDVLKLLFWGQPIHPSPSTNTKYLFFSFLICLSPAVFGLLVVFLTMDVGYTIFLTLLLWNWQQKCILMSCFWGRKE